MQRSSINELIRDGSDFIRQFGYILPPFAFWSPKEMRDRRDAAVGILGGRLGWDVTDYGQGRFQAIGQLLFTVRNGYLEDMKKGKGRLYAEKVMVSRKNQLCAMHRHNLKTSDMINRGGGRLVLELFMSDTDGGIDRSKDVAVTVDGVTRTFPAGTLLKLDPGESVTLTPDVWHVFWAEGMDVLVGEISTVNDDLTDNVLRDPIGRFPPIDEDVPPRHLLVSDYERWVTSTEPPTHC